MENELLWKNPHPLSTPSVLDRRAHLPPLSSLIHRDEAAVSCRDGEGSLSHQAAVVVILALPLLSTILLGPYFISVPSISSPAV